MLFVLCHEINTDRNEGILVPSMSKSESSLMVDFFMLPRKRLPNLRKTIRSNKMLHFRVKWKTSNESVDVGILVFKSQFFTLYDLVFAGRRAVHSGVVSHPHRLS